MKVYDRPCRECLFHNQRLTTDATAQRIVRRLVVTDGHFICHKATISGEEVMCRGHFNAVERGDLRPPQLLRIARRLDAVEFVPLPEVKDLSEMTEEEYLAAVAKLADAET